MPPRIPKYGEKDFWKNFNCQQKQPYLEEKKHNGELLRELVNKMRIRAGKTPANFAALLSFISSCNEKTLIDPSIALFMQKLIQDFQSYLQQDRKLEEKIPADRILAASSGLVSHKVLTKEQAFSFCIIVLKTAVVQQYRSYSAKETAAVLKQIRKLREKSPDSSFLFKIEQALDKQLDTQKSAAPEK